MENKDRNPQSQFDTLVFYINFTLALVEGNNVQWKGQSSANPNQNIWKNTSFGISVL